MKRGYWVITERNTNGKTIFSKYKQGSDIQYKIITLDNHHSFVDKSWLIQNRNSINNMGITQKGQLYVKNELESYIYSWYRYYYDPNKSERQIWKSVISKILDELNLKDFDGLKSRGFDGLVIKNAPIGMKKNQILKEEVVVFYPNQITFREDLRFKKISKRTKMRDNQGNLKTYFHITDKKFDSFDMNYIGTGYGACYGDGFYFSSEIIQEYLKTNSVILWVYLDILYPYIINDLNNDEEVIKFLKVCGVNSKNIG